MKRLLLISLIVSLLEIPSFAQNDFSKEFSIGVNGGANMTSISFNPSVRQKNLMGVVGGISARFVTENHFGIQAELNYSQRGWKEYDPDDSEYNYSRELNYLELPILTHIYFNAGKRVRFVFNLGPQIGILLSEKEIESNLRPGQNPTPDHTEKVQKSFDWGLCFGGGLEIRSGIGSFVLDGRYYYGLSDIFYNSKADYFASSSNQVIGIKLTYFYHLK